MKSKPSSLLMLTLALTSVLMTVVMVNAKPLYGEAALTAGAPGPVHPDYGAPVWGGPITGDISGNIYFYSTGFTDVGQVHFFEEIWLITDGDGDMLLTGTDNGVLRWVNDGGLMNGVVTDAALAYEHLIEHNVHMNGVVTWGSPPTCVLVFRVN